MPSFIIKVAHNGVIRKIGITDGTFPSFTRLSDKIRSVFSISKDQSVTAQKVLYSPDGSGTILLASSVKNDAEWRAALAAWGLYGKPLPPKGSMRMTVVASPVVPSKPNAPPTVAQPVSSTANGQVDHGLINKSNKPIHLSINAGEEPVLVPVGSSAKSARRSRATRLHSYESDDDDGISALVPRKVDAIKEVRKPTVPAASSSSKKIERFAGPGRIVRQGRHTVLEMDDLSLELSDYKDELIPELVPLEFLALSSQVPSKTSAAFRDAFEVSSDDDELPRLIAVTPIARPLASSPAASSSAKQTLQSTLQSSLKTLETLRRLSPPSSTIPLAHIQSGPPCQDFVSGNCTSPAAPAVPSTAVTREDLASALASTKEDIKGILSSFLASYAGKMADTFGVEEVKDEDDRTENQVPGAFRSTSAAQEQPAESTEHKELEVWFDAQGTQIQVWCDGCGNKVGGLRFKCVDCHNFDLCLSCMPGLSTTSTHTSTHRFKPVPHPLLAAHLDNTFRGTSEPVSTLRSSFVAPIIAAAASVASSVVRHHATCDFCSTTIEGDRMKCMQCPDFDSCQACFGITPEQHPGHSFVKIGHPSDLMRATEGPRPVVHRGVVCDGCDSDIRGIRYKCVHPDCADYDLCESCEAAPIERHPKVHPMLKLRVPLQVDAQVWFDDEEPRVTRRNPTEAQLHDQLERATPASFPYGTPAAPSPVATPVPSVATAETPVESTPFERSSAPSPVPRPSSRAPSFVADLVNPVTVLPTEETVAYEALAQHGLPTNGPELKSGLHARFDADITVTDAASFPAGALFVKTWRLQNNGSVAYDPSTALRWSSGEKLQAGADQVTVGAVQPAEHFEVSIEMKAPETAGRFVSFWRLKDAKGDNFGDRVWTDIIVVDPSVRGPSPGTSSISSSSIIMPAAPSVVPAASLPATNSTSSGESAAETLSTADGDSGSDVESVADGSEMSAFGEIEEHEHHEAVFGSEHDEDEEFYIVQDEST